MAVQNTRKGIWLMVATAAVFASQDGISRYLAGEYNVWIVVMMRYWFFAAFVVALAARAPGGFRAAIRTAYPAIQVFRGALLAVQICVVVMSFTLVGLVATHAVFAICPLLIVAFSGPVLGEKVGWRRWTAVGIGLLGVLVILRPGFGVFDPLALIALVGAGMFALYGLLTRKVGDKDNAAVSLFWTGTIGAVTMTAIGLWFWEPMRGTDWIWMGVLCCTGVLGHWLMIRAYEVAEASAVQPFAYLQLVFASLIGMLLFAETLAPNVLIGAAIVVSAGIFALLRSRKVAQGG